MVPTRTWCPSECKRRVCGSKAPPPQRTGSSRNACWREARGPGSRGRCPRARSYKSSRRGWRSARSSEDLDGSRSPEERIIRCEGMRWVYDGQGETQEVGTVCGSELAQSGEVRRWKGREARLAPGGSAARADNIMGEEEYIYHGGEENIQRAHHAYRRETLPTHGHPRRLAKVHVIKVSRQRREGARLILRSPPGHGDCRGPKTVARLARGAREAAVSRAWLQARPRGEGFWTSEDLAGWHRLEYGGREGCGRLRLVGMRSFRKRRAA